MEVEVGLYYEDLKWGDTILILKILEHSYFIEVVDDPNRAFPPKATHSKVELPKEQFFSCDYIPSPKLNSPVYQALMGIDTSIDKEKK